MTKWFCLKLNTPLTSTWLVPKVWMYIREEEELLESDTLRGIEHVAWIKRNRAAIIKAQCIPSYSYLAPCRARPLATSIRSLNYLSNNLFNVINISHVLTRCTSALAVSLYHDSITILSLSTLTFSRYNFLLNNPLSSTPSSSGHDSSPSFDTS